MAGNQHYTRFQLNSKQAECEDKDREQAQCTKRRHTTTNKAKTTTYLAFTLCNNAGVQPYPGDQQPLTPSMSIPKSLRLKEPHCASTRKPNCPPPTKSAKHSP